MCAKCPFRPDGTGYARDHVDFPRIVATVEMGVAFYCHETAIMNPRTTMDDSGDVPDPPVQPHFELCRGGREHYMQKWEERVLAAIAEGKIKT